MPPSAGRDRRSLARPSPNPLTGAHDMSGRIQTLAAATARTLAISFPRVLVQLLGRTSMDACDAGDK